MATQEVSHRMVRNRNGRKYLFMYALTKEGEIE